MTDTEPRADRSVDEAAHLAAETAPAPPVSTRALRLLRLGAFISSFDRFSVAPLLILIAADLDVSLTAATQVATVYFFAYGLMQAVWAALSDRLGRVRTMRIALLVAAVTGLLSAVAPTLPFLLAARLLAGASFAAAVPAAMVYVGDTVPTDRRQAALTDLMTGAAVGMALSTLVAGAAGQYLHWRVVFGLTAVVAAALVWGLRRLPEPPRGARTAFHRALVVVLRDRWARVVLALAFAEGMLLVGFVTFFAGNVQADGLSATLAGSAVTTFGVSTMIFASVVKRLTRRLSPARLTLIGAVFGVLSYTALVIDPHLVGVLVACVLLGAARAFMHSTLQAWITEVVPSQRATAVSLFSTLMFSGSAAATAIGAHLVTGSSFLGVYVLALAIMVPLGVVATAGRHRYALTRR
jgi:MFS transporter, YNFM family, putative membrane transport protein